MAGQARGMRAPSGRLSGQEGLQTAGWAWGKEGGRGGQPPSVCSLESSLKARTTVQATPRPEEGREAKIDYPINQSPGTDYKINHQGKGQVLCYITQPTRFIHPLGHPSLWPSITGSCSLWTQPAQPCRQQHRA